MKCSCGYEHSYQCREVNGTRFISRYRGENDYCVNGRRIGWNDDGSWRREPTELEKEAVLAWEAKFNS